MSLRDGRAVILAALVALTGCTIFRPAPTSLALPERPQIRFVWESPRHELLCLTREDAVKLDKWMNEVGEFEAAWGRLKK